MLNDYKMASIVRFSRISRQVLRSSKKISTWRVLNNDDICFNRWAQRCFSSARSEVLKDDFYVDRLDGDQQG